MERAETQNDTDQSDDENNEDFWAERKREREEYLEKLKKWLDDARLWHYKMCSGIPITDENITENPLHHQDQINNIYATLAQANLWNEQFQNEIRQRLTNSDVATNSNVSNSSPLYQTTTQPNLPPSTYEFLIPPVWKRIVAELMDFLILFLVKMALTFLLLESFDIIDMEFYGFKSFHKNLENHEIGMPMAIELLTLELLHRLIVCAYEAYFLKGKFCATPGKRYMGLMVVTVGSISPVPGRQSETVRVTAATPLGWQKSLSRAALKNFFVGLLLPFCVAFYIFPYNRTAYDMMANSIVVEYHQEFMVYNSAI